MSNNGNGVMTKTRVNHYLDLVVSGNNVMRIDMGGARLILQNIQAIEDFYNRYENEDGSPKLVIPQ